MVVDVVRDEWEAGRHGHVSRDDTARVVERTGRRRWGLEVHSAASSYLVGDAVLVESDAWWQRRGIPVW